MDASRRSLHVYGKTQRGVQALAAARGTLSGAARQLLVLIDGRRNVGELARIFPEDQLANHLEQLEALGLVECLRHFSSDTDSEIDAPAVQTDSDSGQAKEAPPVRATPPTSHAADARAQAPAASPDRNTSQSGKASAAAAEQGNARPVPPAATSAPAQGEQPKREWSPPAAPAATHSPKSERSARPERSSRPRTRPRGGRPVLVVGLLAAAFAGGYAWKDWNGGRFDLGSGNVDRAKADHPVTPRPPATAAAKPKPQDPVAGPIAGAIGNTTATAPATATTSPAAAANSGSQQPAAQPPASAAGAGSQSNLQRPPSGHELRILHQEMLELPQAAKDLGIGTGHVEVLLHVNAQGTVEQVELIHADPPQVYDQAMAQAFGRWTFEPPGVPGRMTVEVEVTPPEKKP